MRSGERTSYSFLLIGADRPDLSVLVTNFLGYESWSQNWFPMVACSHRISTYRV